MWQTEVVDATPMLPVSAFMGLMTLPAYLLISPPPNPWVWRDGFDESWRGALRAKTDQGRTAADVTSSLFLYPGIGYVLIDSWSAGGLRGGAELAGQLTWINFQALTFTFLVQAVISHGIGRERPYGETCQPGQTPEASCAGNDRYQSFFSGHTSVTFTTAGLVCWHHLKLPLYDGGAGDKIACAAAVTAAAATGVLRTVADKHYLSDVLTGMGVGVLSGVGIPWLYYRTGAARRIAARPAEGGTSATVVPTPVGVAVVGAF